MGDAEWCAERFKFFPGAKTPLPATRRISAAMAAAFAEAAAAFDFDFKEAALITWTRMKMLATRVEKVGMEGEKSSRCGLIAGT